jgi:hypothetical protein
VDASLLEQGYGVSSTSKDEYRVQDAKQLLTCPRGKYRRNLRCASSVKNRVGLSCRVDSCHKHDVTISVFTLLY